jgi:F0F1-type ATP synthase membrane subunit b/b'
MRAGSQRQLVFLVPRILTVVGVILVISALLDYAILLYPPDFLDRQWQLNFATQLVDRGIVPLAGLAFIFGGMWTASQVKGRGTELIAKLPLKIPALVLACVLGLLFLVLIPLHWNNSTQARTEQLEQLQEQVQQAQTQLEQQLVNQVEQEQNRIGSLLQNEEELNQAIESGQLSLQQATLLQQFIDEPGSLEQYLDQQAEEFRQEALAEIETRQVGAERQIQDSTVKSGTLTVLSSLLLTIGFTLIGWIGLKERQQVIAFVPMLLVVVGTVLVLVTLKDYLILALPPDFQNRDWLLTLGTQWVDRGIVLLIGLFLTLVGFWSSSQMQHPLAQRVKNLPLVGPMAVLAGILSLLFLILAPLNLNNHRLAQNARLAEIQTQSETAKTGLEQTIALQVQQERNRIGVLLQNQDQLNQAIENGQVSLEQASLLQSFLDQPGSLESYLTAEADKFREQSLGEIDTRQQDLEKQTKNSGFKAGSRTVLTSLLLAIGFGFAGWTGFKDGRSGLG